MLRGPVRLSACPPVRHLALLFDASCTELHIIEFSTKEYLKLSERRMSLPMATLGHNISCVMRFTISHLSQGTFSFLLI